MVYQIFFQKLFQNERRRWLFIFSLVALTHFFCQNLMLPYGNALVSLLPNAKIAIHGKDSFSTEHSMAQTARVGNSILSNASDLTINSLHSGHAKNAEISNVDEPSGHDRELKEKNEERDNNFTSDGQRSDDDSDFVEDENIESDVLFEEIADIDEDLPLQNTSTLGKASENRHSISPGQTVEFSDGSFMNNVLQGNKSVMEEEIATTSTALSLSPVAVQPEDSVMNITFLKKSLSNLNILSDGALDNSLAGQQIKDNVHTESHIRLPSVGANSSNGSATSSIPVRKKMRCEMPPKSITSIYEMNRMLVRNRARSRAMRPRWSSLRDQEIISAKLQIEGAPILKSDRELYAPLFRNISMFKRSYEIMERMLKIYVYKEGEKPIFHQPILKGLYASEGWFMKLLEGNKQFSVKDPRKAHLFYMPFSARMLEHTLYVRNSHNRTNLRQYLKNYAEKIAAKYRFWNRTGGADHFLVACHDWAPYETRHHMEHCMKALCNADVTQAFKIGRDVSLPETYVRSARNPLRDLGGKPPSDRHILAFYAGNIHGYLRLILLKHWKNKDPNMKIFGPMPPGVASKMNYIQHMKSSKYCICPKGYEVNSPRVVEAIFYECVPVIISDNFVPPFFEVLNWDAFSVIIAEKNIPKLKDILLSIPKERYLEMQLGVRKVQKHFLWHPKPMKYDLFHMTLHSIWYNRVFQFKAR